MDQILKASAELSAIVPELWSAAFYPTLLASLPFADSVSKDWEGEIRALGDVVHISSFPQFDDAQEIAEDEKADADAITVSGIPLTINKQVVKDYIITKKAISQSIDASNKLRDLAMHAVLKKMQRTIITDSVPVGGNAFSYTSGSILALADILKAKKALDGANVPDDGTRNMILGSSQWNDIFNITGFTSRDFVPAGSPLSTGALPAPILGFNAKLTTEAAAVSYFFHPMYETIAVQQTPEVGVFDLGAEGKRAMRVNLTVLYGTKLLDGNRISTVS